MKTNWRKIHLLGVAGAISWAGSSLTTFAVVLRDKDALGPMGISLILLSMMVPTISAARLNLQSAEQNHTVIASTLWITTLALPM